MSVTYKDIDQLSQKTSVAGTEKLPVSDTEYITPEQIVANDQKFYFVDGSSSQAGNSTSGSYLSTKWEGTIPGVTSLVNGLKIAYRIKTNTGVATAGAVLSIDGGTTYKPVVFNVNSVITTRYSVGSTILLTYNSTQTATAYLSSGTKSTVTGCWQIMDYDANTNTQVRQYQYGDNAAGTSPKYPLLARYALSNKNGSYDTNYSNYHTGATLDTSTGEIEATSFKKTGGTSSQFLKADGSVDGNSYATTSQIPAEVTESTVSGWGFTKNTGTYSKPSDGIPKTDLASSVQTSLGKADSALQSYTETDPTVPSWAKASTKPTYTASEVGALPDTTVIPTVPTNVSAFTNDVGYAKQVHLADESEMPASPDADTLYLIDESAVTFEQTSNKVTSLSSSSTDTQYPSAKCVYDLVGDIETLLTALL